MSAVIVGLQVTCLVASLIAIVASFAVLMGADSALKAAGGLATLLGGVFVFSTLLASMA